MTGTHHDKDESTGLHKGLNAFHLWGIAVGLVISGEYFGLELWLAPAPARSALPGDDDLHRGDVRRFIFIFSFTELTTAIPQAGGPFAYSRRAFGPIGGCIAGYATLIEFVFPRRPPPSRSPSAPISTSSFRASTRNTQRSPPT